MKGDYIMAEELNVNVTGFNLPPIEVKGTFTFPPIRIEGQNGKSAYELWLEAGNTGTREDFLNSLKGTNGGPGLPGKDASVQGAYEMLLGLNVYCENSTPEEVLKGLIRGLGDVIKKPFKQLEFDRPVKGQTYINVYGTPHFKVALLGKGAAAGASIGDDGQARIDLDNPFMAEDIQIEYFNMLGNSVGTYRVSGYNDVKTELRPTDFADNTITEIDFPEVTTVKDGSFNSLWKLERVNLPKVRRIGQTNFSSSSLTYVSLPMFSLADNSLFDDFLPSKPLTVIVNENSNVDALIALAGLGQTTVFNQTQTKRFDKTTKAWVSA